MATQLDPVIIDKNPQEVTPEQNPPAVAGQAPEGITLPPDDPQPDVAPINLPADANTPSIPPSPALADKKTRRIDYGLEGTIDKDKINVYREVSAGREDLIREQAVRDIESKIAIRKQRLITELANRKGGPLTPEEVDYVLSSGPTGLMPDDVVEKGFAKRYVDTADTTAVKMSSSPTANAYQMIPEQTAQLKETATEAVAKAEYARKLSDDIGNEVSNQGWVPWIADQAKGLFQPYTEYKLRGNNPEVGKLTGGLLLGDNMKEQADKLLNLPYPEFKKQLDTIADGLRKDNPTLAKEFVDYVVGTSASDRQMSNLFSLLVPLDAEAILKAPVGFSKAVKAYNAAADTFKNVVKSTAEASSETPIRAVAAQATGDVAESAVIKTADNIAKEATEGPQPIKDIKSKFTSNFDTDASVYMSNTGKLDREIATRIADNTRKSGQELYDIVHGNSRANRTGAATELEASVRKQLDEIKRSYPGNENALLDIDGFIHEPVTNTNHYTLTFGNNDGTLFASPENAASAAKLRGHADFVIEPHTGTVTVEPEKLTGLKTDIRRKGQLESQLQKLPSDIKTANAKARNKSLTAEERAKAKEDAKFFKETQKTYQEQLDAINKRVAITPARIEQNGAGYTYKILKPYDETAPLARQLLTRDVDDNLIPTSISSASKPEGRWWNSMAGKFRTPEDTLSKVDNQNRKVTTYGASGLQKWIKEKANFIEQVATGNIRVDEAGELIPYWQSKPQQVLGKFTGGNSRMFEEFNSTLRFAQTATDPDTGKIGYYFRTPGELEDHYLRYFERRPTVAEHLAYRTKVDLVEADRLMREISEYTPRARMGAEQHQVFITKDGQRTGSEFFDGMEKHKFPGGDDDIIVLGATPKDAIIYSMPEMNTQLKERMATKVEQGQAKIIEVYNPDHHPLNGFVDVAKDRRIRYIYTEDSASKPLDLNHVERRGGGHFEYDFEHFIKQAIVSKSQTVSGTQDKTKFRAIYLGDRSFLGLRNRALGKNLIEDFNSVRELINEQKFPEAKALFESKQMPMSWDEFKGYFQDRTDPKGRFIPARFSTDEPFYVVPKNMKIYDMDNRLEQKYGASFKDGTKSGSAAAKNRVAYNMERDSEGILQGVDDIGTAGNPVYQLTDNSLMDPIPTMNRALHRAINSVFMDDQKISSIEHWLQEAIPHLKEKSAKEALSSPSFTFETITDKTFKPGVPQEIINNLLSNRMKIKQFQGIPDTFDTWIHSKTQDLADSFYNSYGPEQNRSLAGKAITLTPTYLLSRVRDPIQFIRSMAFNFKLGLFNIPQLLIQAQSHATVWALEPRHGTAGTFAAVMHQWARVNGREEILRALDNKVSSLNVFGSRFKPGEFLEARSELAKTGFEHVAGEYALRDDQLTKSFVNNDWKNFLDAGQWFFREGEKSTRLTAWYTAFRKFRSEHPTGLITDADRAKILDHADMLTNNMSRASSSNLHTGAMGLSTQFLTYQIRSAELFLGKRLGGTTAERMAARARLVALYSALYGIPAGIGVTGWPFGDSIRKAAIDRGYVVGDNFLKTMAMEGIPAITMAMITGGGDYQKGNFYNIGPRYGVQGVTPINEGLKSDASWWRLVGGAGGNIAYDFTSGLASPFWNHAKSLMIDGNKDNLYPITFNDLSHAFDSISIKAASSKLIAAWNTGKWMSNNGKYITDVSKGSALFQFLTSLSPQAQEDIFTKNNIMEAEKAVVNAAQREISRIYPLYLQAMEDNNKTQAEEYARQMRAQIAISGIPLDKRAKLYANGSRGYESQMDSTNFNFGTRSIPTTKFGIFGPRNDVMDTRREQLQRQLQLNDLRK